MKKYKEINIKTTPFIPEILSGFLWELNITGLTEEENYLKIFIDVNAGITCNDINSQLKKLAENNVISSFEIEERILEDKNWNEEWEKGIDVIEASPNIVIKPSFRNYPNKDNKKVIVIDPKMSFGTGHHDTTRLVIQLLEKYIRKNTKILDIGTGTGILSIAAIKLGAGSAVAIDNDELCYENSRENCMHNNVEDKINISLSEINNVNEKGFDIILANIQKNVLMEISGEINKRIKNSGFLILSGLLSDDEEEIINEYEKLNLRFLEKKQSGEWIAVVFKKQ